jgi:hypothetical protein
LLLTGQAPPPDSPLPTIVKEISLVLVDVLAINPVTRRPLKLTASDLEILDNGKPVSMSSFDDGASFHTRPLAVWIIVQCHYRDWPETKASGYFAGNVELFRVAFQFLDKPDKVGIAHWCDDGTAKLDLPPTADPNTVLKNLNGMFETLRPGAVRVDRDGELALQKLLRLIVADTRNTSPEPLPVMVILHDDWTGMPEAEADKVIGEILDTSGIVYGIRDERSPDIGAIHGELDHVFHYFASQTGGEYLNARFPNYGIALADILQQLHFRYQIGFHPQVIDGKRHKLTVRFSPSAAQQYGKVRLRFRAEYLAKRSAAAN